jgi:hypothetical protein
LGLKLAMREEEKKRLEKEEVRRKMKKEGLCGM